MLRSGADDSTTGTTTTATTAAAAAEPYKKEEFSQWMRDLRRAEIVTFGSLPLTLFFSKIGVDSWRFSRHNGDMAYAPWPLKSAGAVEMDENERLLTFSAACASSLAIALIDQVIIRIKRHRALEAERARPHSSLDLLRETPLPAMPPPGSGGSGEPPPGSPPPDAPPAAPAGP